MAKWAHKWDVESSSSDKTYVVSCTEDMQEWGCSCPVWKFRRLICHHITEVKARLEAGIVKTTALPTYVLANVKKPEVKDGKMLIPLVRIGDVDQEATVCAFILKQGYSWAQVRELRHTLPKSWTAQAVLDHVRVNGEATFQ